MASFDYDQLGRLLGTRVNGQQLFKAHYSDTDIDLADPDTADAYSPITYVDLPAASAIFGSMLTIVYGRTHGSALGAIRFHPTMGRFVLSDITSTSPDAVLLASLQRRGLPIAERVHHGYMPSNATVSFAPVGFDKPSNGLFVPPEYSTLNCYQCYGYIGPYIVSTINGSTGSAQVTVGQQVNVDTYDQYAESACFVPDGCEFPPCYQMYRPELQVSYGDGGAEYGWLGWWAGESTFLHSYASPGSYSLQRAVSCGFACPGAQFIQIAAATVTVNACAVPTNFHQTSTSSPSPGNLRFDYAWSSSSGNLTDLLQCEIGESVVYPGGASQFPRPHPFPAGSHANPTELSDSAETGEAGDIHMVPIGPFRTPYSAAAYTGSQIYRYRCPCANGGNWVTVFGPLAITRDVSQNSNGTWRYRVTKPIGGQAEINPLP